MLNVAYKPNMLSVIMLNGDMVSVIMPSVVAPYSEYFSGCFGGFKLKICVCYFVTS
jgi:hypothetical protein